MNKELILRTLKARAEDLNEILEKNSVYIELQELRGEILVLSNSTEVEVLEGGRPKIISLSPKIESKDSITPRIRALANAALIALRSAKGVGLSRAGIVKKMPLRLIKPYAPKYEKVSRALEVLVEEGSIVWERTSGRNKRYHIKGAG